MVEYSKINVKLTDRQPKQLKTTVENKTGTTLRMNLKMFNGNDLPHELLLTTRQKTNLRTSLKGRPCDVDSRRPLEDLQMYFNTQGVLRTQ